MMSRPSAFRRLALSAITMIALGFARLMRWASWGISVLVLVRWGTLILPFIGEAQWQVERGPATAMCWCSRVEGPTGRNPGLRGVTTPRRNGLRRSEEHTSELQSLMRISYAVFCLKKKKQNNT